MKKQTTQDNYTRDKQYMLQLKKMRCNFRLYEMRDKEVAQLLNCSKSNVTHHWNTGSFTGEQVFIMQRELDKLEREAKERDDFYY